MKLQKIACRVGRDEENIGHERIETEIISGELSDDDWYKVVS